MNDLTIRRHYEYSFSKEPISYESNNEQIVSNLYQEIARETEEHKVYLTTIGLGERAIGIQFKYFEIENLSVEVDLSPFAVHTAIPREVIDFDPQAKNILITTDPFVKGNREEDLQKILDIRLYPSLRNLIKQYGVHCFLGSIPEMNAYYEMNKTKLFLNFQFLVG